MADEPSSSSPDSGSGEPKKYIRTFAGDIETVQKGGTPDLTPLTVSESRPLDRIVAPSPVPSAPEVPPAPDAPQPAPPPVTPPAPVPTPLETYSTDFSNHIKETKASPATVLAAEQDAAPALAPAPEKPQKSKSGLIYVIAGIILFVAGAAGAYVAYRSYQEAQAPVPITTPQIKAPIFVDEQEEVFGTGEDLLRALQQSAAKPLAQNTVRLLYASSTQSIFSMLPLGAPSVLTRNVSKEGSMAGVVNTGNAQTLFFVLSVASYSDTFAGMLSWESAMLASLDPLFAAAAPAFPGIASTTIATSSSQSTATTTATTTKPTSIQTPQKPATTTSYTVIYKPGFKDEVISNQDVRVYRDEKGTGRVVYGYWNQSTLIIARDPEAFMEIVSRLATTRTQ